MSETKAYTYGGCVSQASGVLPLGDGGSSPQMPVAKCTRRREVVSPEYSQNFE